MNEHQDKTPQRPRADWTAWSLQLVFGLIVGACIGSFIWGRMLRLDMIGRDQWPGIVFSVALVVGAITSRRGDRAWFRASLFDPEPPPQSPASKAASVVIGSYGILLFGLTLLNHLGTVQRADSRSGFFAINVFQLFVGGIIAFLVIYALRTDRACHKYGFFTREDEPLAFWLYVGSGVLSVFYIAVNALL